VIRTVAVLGGGPAGAFAAEQLARGGVKTRLFDEKLAWEKPCGGGLSYKAYRDYPFLANGETAKRLIPETTLSTRAAGEMRMKLRHPLIIYSRVELNGMLLARAEQAGVAIEKTRVMGLDPTTAGWRVRTRAGAVEVDYCIVATGARNPLRDFGTHYTAEDTMSTLGYYVQGTQARIDIQFLTNLEGYIWVFPRCDHLSVGICGKGAPAKVLRDRLELFLRERGIPFAGERFYSHVLPSLAQASWESNRRAGDRWMAIGDAAGLVDPVTGEGLYYAIRSGDLASRVILDEAIGTTDKPIAYRSALANEFTDDLRCASRIARRLYLGSFALGSMPDRLIQMSRRSALLRDVVQDLFAGVQPYSTLKSRLKSRFTGTMTEVLASFVQRRVEI
jgi:flavin-dependent dehydrogenase